MIEIQSIWKIHENPTANKTVPQVDVDKMLPYFGQDEWWDFDSALSDCVSVRFGHRSHPLSGYPADPAAPQAPSTAFC